MRTVRNMGVLSRLIRSAKSGVGGLLAPAQDPRQTFANAYQRQRELLLGVEQALTTVGSSKNRLGAKMAEVRDKLPEFEAEALNALKSGREDLARLLLQRRHVAVVELQTLEHQVHEVEQEEHRLTVLEQRLATQIEAFQSRLEVIAARYSTAEAQVRMQEIATGISDELADLGTALQQAEGKMENMEARATAIDRLVEAGALGTPASPAGKTLERELAQIDVSRAVEEQMNDLRKKVEK